MTIWDVVVMGAGPAGAVAARTLTREGRAVLLVDKSTFPRAKVCGGCLNRAARSSLSAVGLGHLAEECGAVRAGRARIATGPARFADIPLPETYSVSRETFDAALVSAADAAGVTVRKSVRASLGPVFPDFRTVHLHATHQEEVRARVVVDATGLAGASGQVSARSRIGVGTVIPAADAPPYYEPGTVYMAVSPVGYVGLVRVEKDRLDVAAALDPSFVRSRGSPKSAVHDILARTGWPPIECHSWKGTPPLTRRPSTRAGTRLFAIGDAAGYVEPFTGEGMAWAFASAISVAPLVSRAVDSWNASLADEWNRTYARLIGRRQRTCRVVARVLRSATLTGLAVRAVSAFPALSRPVVSALNRPATLLRRSRT